VGEKKYPSWYDCFDIIIHTRREEFMIPNIDFTTLMLNVSTSDIKKSDIIVIDDTVYYDITLVRKPMSCPYCRGKMIGHGHKLRLIKHPAIRDTNGLIRYNANRYKCKDCSKTALEKNPFTFSGFNSSFLLLQSAMKMLANLNYTLSMISEELNISSTQLSKYIDSYITIPHRPLPTNLGIDELYSPELSRRKSSYLCILVDNEKRTVYDILDSRSKINLALYFSQMPREERCNVKYITIDMWEPYKEIAETYFPNCIVAVDPFHVIKHLNKNFDRLRLDLMNQCEYGSNAYYLLKKWSWLLTAHNVYLDNDRVYNNRFKMKLNRRDLRTMIFDAFPILYTAYQLKERYRIMNNECSFEEASSRYDDIAYAFKCCGIRQFEEFTSILFTWKEEILNSFHRPFNNRKLSNSFTENINGRLRTYLTISRGIGNFERFRKRTIYALSSDVQYGLTSNLTSDKRYRKKRGPYCKNKD
jgi:transposase